MDREALVADGIDKIYRLYASPWQRAAELLQRRTRHRPFHALRDVCFRVESGQRLGVIGENGAGKSTLLEILAGVTTPTRGSVQVPGRVAAVLELGSGFHPELSGRQNVALNAAMLGLSNAELAARFDSIVEFSELGAFIDQPVKSYSTGMAMRLAFSVATQVEPDVLIIDEALSVGDGYFQRKCSDRLRELADERRFLLFCSHSLAQVTAFCTHALWLRRGRVAALGPVLDVVRAYEGYLSERREESSSSETPHGRGPARLFVVRQSGFEAPAQEAPWRLEIAWRSDDPALAFHVAVGVDRTEDGVQLCSFATHQDRLPPFSGRREYRLALEAPRLPVAAGRFTIYVFLLDEEGLHIYDRAVLADAIVVDRNGRGLLEVPHTWSAPEIAGLSGAGPPR